MRIATATVLCIFAGVGLMSFATGDKNPVTDESTVVAEPSSPVPLAARFAESATYGNVADSAAVPERGRRGPRANDIRGAGQGQGRFQLRDGSGSGARYGREGASRGSGHRGKGHGGRSGGQGRGNCSGSGRGHGH